MSATGSATGKGRRDLLARLQSGRIPISECDSAPSEPGLYAVWATRLAAEDLDLRGDWESVPLYVGKSDKRTLRVRLREHRYIGDHGYSILMSRIGVLLWLQDLLPWPVHWLAPSLPPRLKRPAQTEWEAYARQAFVRWQSTGLEVSWAAGQESAAAEERMIRALRPPFNVVYTVRPGRDEEVLDWFGPVGRVGLERGVWEMRAQEWLVQHTAELTVLGGDEVLQVPLGDDNSPTLDAPLTVVQREELPDDDQDLDEGKPRFWPIAGDRLQPIHRAQELALARPRMFWHTPSSLTWGQPPDWDALTGSLTESEQRMLIVLSSARVLFKAFGLAFAHTRDAARGDVQ